MTYMTLPEELGQFRLLHTDCLANLKGSVGLILAKSSTMRISIPLDLHVMGVSLRVLSAFLLIIVLA